MKIGNAIRLIRVRKNLSQIELSRLAGLSTSYVSLVENGKRNLTFSVLQRIAAALDKPVFLLTYLTENGTDSISDRLASELMFEAMR